MFALRCSFARYGALGPTNGEVLESSTSGSASLGSCVAENIRDAEDWAKRLWNARMGEERYGAISHSWEDVRREFVRS